MAVFDPFGALIEFDVPRFFPSPPKKLRYKRLEPNVCTAAEAGYSEDAAPTKCQPAAQKKDIKKCAMVRYLLTLELARADVEALWPSAQISADTDYRKFLDTPVSQWQAQFGNALMSTCGEKSSGEWLTRLITGTVEMYDFRVWMFNIRCEIATCYFADDSESEEDMKDRLELLGNLRIWFWFHKHKMLDRIEGAKREIRKRAGNADWQELHGNTDDPAYLEYLNKLYKEFNDMELFEKPRDRSYIPERRLLYADEFGMVGAGEGFREFWEPAWQQKGTAESFLSEFDDALYIKGCIDENANDACASYFQWLFESVCHYSYISQVWRIHENTVISQRSLYCDIRGPVSLPIAPKVVFELLREFIRGQEVPYYDEIMVRAAGDKMTKKRATAVSRPHVTSRRAPKRPILLEADSPSRKRKRG